MHSNSEETPKHTPRINVFNVRHKSTVISRCYQNIVRSSTSIYVLTMAPFELTF